MDKKTRGLRQRLGYDVEEPRGGIEQTTNLVRSIVAKYKAKRASKQWLSTPLGKALFEHTNQFISNREIAGLAHTENFVSDLDEKLTALGKDENALLTFRTDLADFVSEFASLKVLCLTEEQKAKSAWSQCPYISGKLHDHIQGLTGYNESLKSAHAKYPGATSEELMTLCELRCAVLDYYIKGYDIVRHHEPKETIEEEDWLGPFIESQLIWYEDFYREQVSLPSLLSPSLPFDVNRYLYELFYEAVTSGAANPYRTWKRAQEDDTDDQAK